MARSGNDIGWLETSAVALAVQAIAQFAVGLWLAHGYSASIAGAYDSVSVIRSNGLGQFLAGFHYWGSALLIVHSWAHLSAMLWLGLARKSWMRYYGSLLVALSSYLLQVTGNLLPMDRHGVQTVVVESGVAASVPVFGQTARHLVLAGDGFGQSTLSRWSMLHAWLLPVALLGGILLLTLGPSERETRSHPIFRWAPIALLVLVAAFVHAPRGLMATETDFSKFGAHVSWYTWPLHGTLGAFTALSPKLAWVGVAVIPGLFVAFLALIPFLNRISTNATVQSVFVVFALIFLGSGIGFGGSVASLVGNRDPALPPPSVAPKVDPNAPPVDQAVVEAGRQIFNGKTAGCYTCHGVDGKKGDVGPTLTDEYKQHDVDWLMKYIHDPKSVDTSSTMPDFKDMSQDDLKKVATFVGTKPAGA